MDAGASNERGMSLLGLVVALALLGGLAAMVLWSLDAGPFGGVAGVGGVGAPVDRLLGPSGPADPLGAPAPGRGPAGVVDASSVAACRSDVATLESAMAAARTSLGAYPPSLADLAAKGFLSEVPARPGFTFAPETAEGSPTGRITVNGRPGPDGCETPAAAGR